MKRVLSLLMGSENGRAVSVRRCQGEGCRTCPATASGVVIEQMVVGGGCEGGGDDERGGGGCGV
jgi:hypothetical protein